MIYEIDLLAPTTGSTLVSEIRVAHVFSDPYVQVLKSLDGTEASLTFTAQFNDLSPATTYVKFVRSIAQVA